MINERTNLKFLRQAFDFIHVLQFSSVLLQGYILIRIDDIYFLNIAENLRVKVVPFLYISVRYFVNIDIRKSVKAQDLVFVAP